MWLSILYILLSFTAWATNPSKAIENQPPTTICSDLLSNSTEKQAQDLRPALLGKSVTVDSEIGPLQIGIVNVDFPGVAEAISTLLIRSISDARQSNSRPGHLPDHLVEDVIRQYISPEKVKTFWRYHGHRFAVMNSKGEIVGTMLLGIDKETLIYLNRWKNNVPASEHPGVKPAGYHQMMNLSVRHELRRSKIASVMLDTITRHFRHLFNGKGIWMRADPPWHDKLAGLGFKHDPSMDSFLPENVESTLGLPHSQYNAQFRCSCHTDHPENPSALVAREAKAASQKLQYFSFTRDFDPSPRLQPRNNINVDVLIVGGGIMGTAFALKLREVNPKLKTLIVSRDQNFAFAGHGHLYPMTEMDHFRFPGRDSIQPKMINNTMYPGEVERALAANQENLNIWVGESVEKITSNGSILLKSGVEIQARSVVVATGVSAVNSDILDESAQSNAEDFVTFSRALAQLPYVHSTPGSWGTVAVLGDGAAGRALVRQLQNDSGRVAKKIQLIGENASGETILKVSYVSKQFQIEVRSRDGQIYRYSADRVVTGLGFNNRDTQKLAEQLKTNLVIGAGAFEGSAPSMVKQIQLLSEKAIQLNTQLTRGPL